MPILDWVGFTEARRENFARRGRRRRHTVLPLHSDRALPAHSFGISQSASGVIVSSEAANVSSSRLSLSSHWHGHQQQPAEDISNPSAGSSVQSFCTASGALNWPASQRLQLRNRKDSARVSSSSSPFNDRYRHSNPNPSERANLCKGQLWEAQSTMIDRRGALPPLKHFVCVCEFVQCTLRWWGKTQW